MTKFGIITHHGKRKVFMAFSPPLMGHKALQGHRCHRRVWAYSTGLQCRLKHRHPVFNTILLYRWSSSNLNLLGNQLIEPCSVAAVLLEAIRLQQLRHELHRRTEVSADRQLFQCHHHVPAHSWDSEYSFSALTLLAGRQEGHLACKKLGAGLLVVMFWLELCTSIYSSSCHHHLHHP